MQSLGYLLLVFSLKAATAHDQSLHELALCRLRLSSAVTDASPVNRLFIVSLFCGLYDCKPAKPATGQIHSVMRPVIGMAAAALHPARLQIP